MAETLLAGGAALARTGLRVRLRAGLVPLLVAAVAVPICFPAINGLSVSTSVSRCPR